MKIETSKGMVVVNCFLKKNPRLVLKQSVAHSANMPGFCLRERILHWESGVLNAKQVLPLTSHETPERSLNLSGL